MQLKIKFIILLLLPLIFFTNQFCLGIDTTFVKEVGPGFVHYLIRNNEEPININVLEIDLTYPGVKFEVGIANDYIGEGGETTSEFVKRNQKDWIDIFKDLDACVIPINSFAEACEDPQIKARKMVVKMDHPKFGVIQNISSPIKYSRTPLEIKTLAPKLGQHTKEILIDLGYSEEDIRSFRKKGVI